MLVTHKLTHAHTHTYTRTLTRIYTHTHTYTHAHSHTYTHTLTDLTRIYTHTDNFNLESQNINGSSISEQLETNGLDMTFCRYVISWHYLITNSYNYDCIRFIELELRFLIKSIHITKQDSISGSVPECFIFDVKVMNLLYTYIHTHLYICMYCMFVTLHVSRYVCLYIVILLFISHTCI